MFKSVHLVWPDGRHILFSIWCDYENKYCYTLNFYSIKLKLQSNIKIYMKFESRKTCYKTYSNNLYLQLIFFTA